MNLQALSNEQIADAFAAYLFKNNNMNATTLIQELPHAKQESELAQVAAAVCEEKPDAPRWRVYPSLTGAAVLWFSGTLVRCRLHPHACEKGYAFTVYVTDGTSETYLFSGLQKAEHAARIIAPIVAQQLLGEPGVVYDNTL